MRNTLEEYKEGLKLMLERSQKDAYKHTGHITESLQFAEELVIGKANIEYEDVDVVSLNTIAETKFFFTRRILKSEHERAKDKVNYKFYYQNIVGNIEYIDSTMFSIKGGDSKSHLSIVIKELQKYVRVFNIGYNTPRL